MSFGHKNGLKGWHLLQHEWASKHHANKPDSETTYCFRVHEMSMANLKAESKLVDASGWGPGPQWLQRATEDLSWSYGNVLKLDSRESCTILWIYQHHLIVHFKKWVLCKLYLNKTIRKKLVTRKRNNQTNSWAVECSGWKCEPTLISLAS